MELHLGRRLHTNEAVHHINGNTQDNRIENLKLMGHGAHTAHHNNHRTYRKGYKLNLTSEQRKARSDRAKAMKLDKMGRDTLSKANAKD